VRAATRRPLDFASRGAGRAGVIMMRVKQSSTYAMIALLTLFTGGAAMAESVLTKDFDPAA
jgi:hypothetical protein